MRLETEQDQIDLTMLDHLYDNERSISELIAHHGDDEQCRSWLVSAQDRGLIRKNQRLNPGFSLTDEGRRRVQEARKRRDNTGYRRRELHSRVLAWADAECEAVDRPEASPQRFSESQYATLDGAPFGWEQVNEAVGFLVSGGLLRCPKNGKAAGFGYISVGITHEGRECATDYGYDVAAYLARQRQTGTSISISGSKGNALSFALGPHSTATAMTVNIDHAVLLAQAVKEAAPLLGLGDDAQQAVADIEQRHDPGRVRRGLQWIAGLANGSATGALGTVLGTLALNLLGITPGM